MFSTTQEMDYAMSNDTWTEEEDFDITGPFALFMIAYLRWLAEEVSQ